MFLFILESIGTSELILIGIIALIFLGPRKLPQIARTIGKTMADFRSTTNEFKSTWEREVNFAEEAEALRAGDLPSSQSATVPRETVTETTVDTLAMPEIKPAQPSMFEDVEGGLSTPVVEQDIETTSSSADVVSEKKNWL